MVHDDEHACGGGELVAFGDSSWRSRGFFGVVEDEGGDSAGVAEAFELLERAAGGPVVHQVSAGGGLEGVDDDEFGFGALEPEVEGVEGFGLVDGEGFVAGVERG